MYPGGTFVVSRSGSEFATWIRPGDVLLFDVAKKVLDGTYHAVPTTVTRRASVWRDGCTIDNDSTKKLSPSIRLVEPSLCGRAEGVIQSIHDNYGFIRVADRNVDAYFPLFEVFPAEIVEDLVRNIPDVYREDCDLIRKKGGRIHVEVGMEVAFDISMQVLTNVSRAGRDDVVRSKQNSPAQEKESLRARRVQILPQGTVRERITVASGVKATVATADAAQLFTGLLEFEEPFKVEYGIKHRHPLVARLVDSISNGKFGSDKVTFHDVLSEIDSQIVISMVDSREDLEWNYVYPENSPGDVYNRRLCIMKKRGISNHNSSVPFGRPPVIKEPTNQAEVEAVDNERAHEESADDDFQKAEKNQVSSKNKNEGEAKLVKSLRYDKFSFLDMSASPFAGDVVTCDLVLSRRSGKVNVENIIITERKERKAFAVSEIDVGTENAAMRTSLRGFVTEVVPRRQFGFITTVDELGTKTGEHIFFHYKEVESSCADMSHDGSPVTSIKFRKSFVINKGDEVACNARPGKNGKLNATNIFILPRGTLKPIKSDPSFSCTGYILIEPSRNLLIRTPSHTALQSTGVSAGVGRWTNVRDDMVSATNKVGSSLKGEGVILLLTGLSQHFSLKPNVVSPSNDLDSGNRADSTESELQAHAVSEVGNSTKVEEEDDNFHLGYKFSSLAERCRSTGANRPDGPKRGDLVSFCRVRGSRLVKDIRIVDIDAATIVRGTLVNVDKDDDSAIFVVMEDEVKYEIKLTEVVSCDAALVNENEKVDGILHEGKIYGGKIK